MVGCLRGAVGFTPGATVDGGPTGECGVIYECHFYENLLPVK